MSVYYSEKTIDEDFFMERICLKKTLLVLSCILCFVSATWLTAGEEAQQSRKRARAEASQTTEAALRAELEQKNAKLERYKCSRISTTQQVNKLLRKKDRIIRKLRRRVNRAELTIMDAENGATRFFTHTTAILNNVVTQHNQRVADFNLLADQYTQVVTENHGLRTALRNSEVKAAILPHLI